MVRKKGGKKVLKNKVMDYVIELLILVVLNIGIFQVYQSMNTEKKDLPASKEKWLENITIDVTTKNDTYIFDFQKELLLDDGSVTYRYYNDELGFYLNTSKQKQALQTEVKRTEYVIITDDSYAAYNVFLGYDNTHSEVAYEIPAYDYIENAESKLQKKIDSLYNEYTDKYKKNETEDSKKTFLGKISIWFMSKVLPIVCMALVLIIDIISCNSIVKKIIKK